MTSHGDARVRPDGKVNAQVAITEDNYRWLFAESKRLGWSMGEIIDHLIGNDPAAQAWKKDEATATATATRKDIPIAGNPYLTR